MEIQKGWHMRILDWSSELSCEARCVWKLDSIHSYFKRRKHWWHCKMGKKVCTVCVVWFGRRRREHLCFFVLFFSNFRPMHIRAIDSPRDSSDQKISEPYRICISMLNNDKERQTNPHVINDYFHTYAMVKLGISHQLSGH